MTRDHTYMDEQFGSNDYDPYDPGEFKKGLVFVIMSFKEELDNVYKVIEAECKKLNLETRRADQHTIGSGIIIKEITQLIEWAEFIICDLTYEPPNVYYELGYAHGVGNEAADILLIARDGTKLHFDAVPLRVHFYSSTEHLRGIISSNMKRMIEYTRR